LDQIGHLKILKKLPSIFIPASVVQEIRHDTSSADLKSLEKWTNSKIISPSPKIHSQVDTIIRKFPLHRGEIDCLQLAMQLAMQLDFCVFLTDDLSARKAAEKLKIEVHGTIGVIAYAVRQKWLSIEKAEYALNLLYHRSNLFITYTIIEQAVKSLKNF
jgi:predicted nucleic acid-binding protein